MTPREVALAIARSVTVAKLRRVPDVVNARYLDLRADGLHDAAVNPRVRAEELKKAEVNPH